MLQLTVGDKRVHLLEVGPAHTKGDVLIHVPEEKVIFTGDILFIGGTPIIWAGPVGNWIKACELIMSLDVETVVPGHGPITDKEGVRQVRDYLGFIDKEAKSRFDAGMDFEEAARDIALGEYRNWTDYERIVVNVDALFREYRGDTSPPDHGHLFGCMAQYYWDHHR
jgi:glyoxylase-like metal-dependent hydrolase (beta-lactamase superfamily II)